MPVRTFDANTAFLTVIDIQGRLAEIVQDSDRLLCRVLTLIKGLRLLGIPTIWVEQLPEKLGPTVPLLSEVLSKSTTAIPKHHFSAMGCTGYRTALADLHREHAILVGIEAHICVYQSARDLLAEGYRVTVAADGVSSRSKVDRKIGIDSIRESGGMIRSVEQILFELLETPNHPQFKSISSLVK